MKIQIVRNGHLTWLNLPCTEQEMQDAEQEIGITDPKDTKFLLVDIDSGISELNVLSGKVHDLDHLNLLARYIHGMCEGEFNQYRAALFITKATDLKDIINLTQHTQNYSLIAPTDTLESAGRNHYLDLHGCYTVGEEEKLNFSGIAAELIASGKGISTPYGLVFENGLDCPEFFNGVNIPCYYDRQFVFGYSISNGYNEEYIFLPCHDTEIDKAMKRLGVQDLSQCRVTYEDFGLDSTTPFHSLIEELEVTELYDLNRLAYEIQDFNAEKLIKLYALFAYTQEHECIDPIRAMTCLADHIDDFDFAPNAASTEELGEYLIRESGRYDYDPELEDYYMFDQFGEDTMSEQDGMFLEIGYVGIRDDIQLWEILEQDGQQMGGIQ